MARRKTAAPITIYDREANAPDPAVLVFGMTERGLPQASCLAVPMPIWR